VRDPLSGISVKYKLAMMFAGVCLLAFGVGGALAGSSARAALEREIRARVAAQSRNYATRLAAQLRLFGRRAEDFASDGYVRDRLERLSADASDVGARGELERHLATNKLPLVFGFVGLATFDGNGASTARVGCLASTAFDAVSSRRATAPREDVVAEATLFGPARRVDRPDANVVLTVSTPVRSLDGSRVVGRLAAAILPGAWIAEAFAGADADPTAEVDVALVGPDGGALLLDRRLTETLKVAAESDLLRSGFGVALASEEPPVDPRAATERCPVGDTGWTIRVARDLSEPLAAWSGLQSKLVGIGAALSVLAGVFFWFPLRYLAAPLARLSEAAEKLRRGERAARVDVEGDDEIAALGASFNAMADAVAQRTADLESAAVELRSNRDELRGEKERLAGVIASMRDALVVLDADGRPVVANAAARPLVDAMARTGATRSHHLCREAIEGVDCASCLADGGRAPTSCLVDAGGGVWDVRTTRLPPDARGRIGRVVVARDVTARVAEDERQIHQERLSVLGEVAAVMAHELNNPLAAVSMFNGMLEDDLPPESPLREHAAVIRRNVETCKKAIRALLDYATDASPEIAPVDVHDVLEDVARFLRPMSDRARVVVERRFDAAASEIVGDEVQLRQVFVNLVVNAIQAMRGKGGVVRLATRDGTDGLEVDVADEGPGVPDDVRERIFKPFFTTKARGEGTGLGLSTARRIAELHGGALDLAASSAEGSVFRARFTRRGRRS
jgi:signal transduction histidine kinase